MKKLMLLGAAGSALLMADALQTDSLEALLESKKTTTKEKSIKDIFEVSLILDGSYTTRKFDSKEELEHLEIPGLVHGGHGDDGHEHTPLDGNKGLQFDYAELHIGAQLGEYLDLTANFHITEDVFETEELFGVTRGLPYGLSLKAGKFRSDFGYLNNKHEHSYNFFELPLVYKALLGEHCLLEEGAQLQYVFPTSYYLMGGIEAFRGENEQSFGYESFIDGVKDVSYPSLYVGYLKTSVDIGGGTLLAGLSGAKGDARMNHLEDEEEPHAFSGTTTLYGADMTYKYYFAADHAITFQNEYLYRKMDGTQYGDGLVVLGDMLKKQAGFYSELVYQYDLFWRGGVRYSSITRNDVMLNSIKKPLPDDIWMTSAMVEYNFSEYSRIRLQYNHNASLYDENGLRNNKKELIVQFTYAFGAHGAHAF